MKLNSHRCNLSAEESIKNHISNTSKTLHRTEHGSLSELPNLEETEVYSSWLKLLYKKQAQRSQLVEIDSTIKSLKSSIMKVDLLIKRLTLVGKLSRSEWLIGSQLAKSIYSKAKPNKRTKYASIFAVSLYIAHKFVVDSDIWFPKEFGQIVGIHSKELISLTLKYLRVLEYRIPLTVNSNKQAYQANMRFSSLLNHQDGF